MPVGRVRLAGVDTRPLLHDVADRAADWLGAVSDRPIGPARTFEELEVTGTLGDAPMPVDQVIAELVEQAEPGLLGINSPRFFGFVMGGAHPAGIAADCSPPHGIRTRASRLPPRRRPPSKRSPGGG